MTDIRRQTITSQPMNDGHRAAALIYQLRIGISPMLLRKWCKDAGIERDYDTSEDAGKPIQHNEV